MRIISWNINSVRIRGENIKQVCNNLNPDIICFQEIKVIKDLFPYKIFEDLGFKYFDVHGEKSYNGVAIVSKIPFTDPFSLKFVKEDSRHHSIKVNSVELHNFYVPAGGDIPDPELNPKFAHKLEYLDCMNNWLITSRSSQDKLVILGDLNIAPLTQDVWSSKQLRNEVSHTVIERNKLIEIQNSLNFIDSIRLFVPESEKLYSWWSYRSANFLLSDRGRRLDHIWVSPILRDNIKEAFIYKEARSQVLPSDHVPVVLDLEV